MSSNRAPSHINSVRRFGERILHSRRWRRSRSRSGTEEMSSKQPVEQDFATRDSSSTAVLEDSIDTFQPSVADNSPILSTALQGQSLGLLRSRHISRSSSTDSFEQISGGISGVEFDDASPDIWSAAFREAVANLGSDIDTAILKGKNIEQVFRQLEEMDRHASEDSIFVRGVKFLHSIKVPLEKFKLALDLASPFASFEPTAKAVFGVVTGVTAIAISFASADVDFGKQIGEMLDQLSYIDECDTLGQRTNQRSIHKALVPVYTNLLEFYQASFEILNRKGVKLVLKMALENNRLPGIVEDFLKSAEVLHKLVQVATAEIISEIKLMLYDQEIARLLGGDKVKRQSEHHATLRYLGASGSWNSLLKDPKFVAWYQASESSQLGIFGNLGIGKSVAAASLVDELLQRKKYRVPRPVLCYHYCRDDETGRISHILCVLILSLMEQLPGLKKAFHDWYKQNQALGYIEPANDPSKLESFLRETLLSLDRPLVVVIDGLDEADRHSRIQILNLVTESAKANPAVKCMFFSRFDEEVLSYFDSTKQIELRPDPGRDRIIATHHVEAQLPHYTPEFKEMVIDKLSRSANGSAIWTKMVIDLLRDLEIRSLLPLQRFLDKMPLPSNLTRLYDDIILRSTSHNYENRQLTRFSLRILAATHRPLSLSELAWATAMAMAPSDVTSVAHLVDFVDEGRVAALVAPLTSRGEARDSHYVRIGLLHQSIKEYIVEDMRCEQADRREAGVFDSQELRADEHHLDKLDAFMLNVCVRYLLLDEIGITELFSEEQIAINELPQDIDLFDDDLDAGTYTTDCTWEEWELAMPRYDPAERGFGGFFAYASSYWLNHFKSVGVTSLPDVQSLQKLSAAGSTLLHNWTQQNCRPGCVMKPRFEFDSRQYDPLGIASLYSSNPALPYLIEHFDVGTKEFLPSTAVAATEQILRWGDLSRLRSILLADRARLPLMGIDFWWLIVQHWKNEHNLDKNWDSVFALIDDNVGALIKEGSTNEILCIAAGAGCLPLIRHLLANAEKFPPLRNELFDVQRGTRFRWLNHSSHQSVGEAVRGNHVKVVELLLAQDGIRPHLHWVNSDGETVLHAASIHCDPRMFRLLLNYLDDRQHETDKRGETALVRVISSSATPAERLKSAQILLESSTTVRIPREANSMLTPLSVAAARKDPEMCSLLKSYGEGF